MFRYFRFRIKCSCQRNIITLRIFTSAIFIEDIFRGPITVAQALISKKSSKHISVTLNGVLVFSAPPITVMNDSGVYSGPPFSCRFT